MPHVAVRGGGLFFFFCSFFLFLSFSFSFSFSFLFIFLPRCAFSSTTCRRRRRHRTRPGARTPSLLSPYPIGAAIQQQTKPNSTKPKQTKTWCHWHSLILFKLLPLVTLHPLWHFLVSFSPHLVPVPLLVLPPLLLVPRLRLPL